MERTHLPIQFGSDRIAPRFVQIPAPKLNGLITSVAGLMGKNHSLKDEENFYNGIMQIRLLSEDQLQLQRPQISQMH